MNADSPTAQAAQKRLVVDVEGSGDMDPAEADLLLGECLSLMDKRRAAAPPPALAGLPAAPRRQAPHPRAAGRVRRARHGRPRRPYRDGRAEECSASHA